MAKKIPKLPQQEGGSNTPETGLRYQPGSRQQNDSSSNYRFTSSNVHNRTRHLSVGNGGEESRDDTLLSSEDPLSPNQINDSPTNSPNSDTAFGGARPRTVSFGGVTNQRPLHLRRSPTPAAEQSPSILRRSSSREGAGPQEEGTNRTSPPSPWHHRRSPAPSIGTDSSPPTPKEVRGRRRRLDSLNLDPPRHPQSDHQQDDHHFFHFRGFPNFGWRSMDQQGSDGRDTVVQGEELYLHFFHERLRNEGLGDDVDQAKAELETFHNWDTHFHTYSPLDSPTSSGGDSGRVSPVFEGGGGATSLLTTRAGPNSNRRNRTLSMNLENFQDPIWRQTGRDLQILADQFAQSHERLLVRQLAEEVDFTSLDKEKFIAMLAELFKGGQVTRERILVLFFFCSDVAIFAIKGGFGRLISSLTEWSLIFIKEQVCSWVENNGGWREVLRSGLNFVQQSLMVGTCAMVIACCAIYIRKNLSSS